MKRITSIPDHYRPLGDKEKIRPGDLYYCVLDRAPTISGIKRMSYCLGNETTELPSFWPDFKFFRRRHVPTKQTETRVALNESVKHWDRLANGTSAKNEGTGHRSCALCAIFYIDGACNGCPVKNATGFNFCEGSPYIAVNGNYGGKDNPRFQAKAAKFRDWLKKLEVEDENV